MPTRIGAAKQLCSFHSYTFNYQSDKLGIKNHDKNISKTILCSYWRIHFATSEVIFLVAI